MHLVVTSRARIEAAYGPDAFDHLGTALLAYSAALGENVPHELLAVDDAASAALLNIEPVTATDATSIATAIRAARQSASDPITSVLLVGGPDIIPFFPEPSPIPQDNDSSVATDNPYGCATADQRTYPVPDIAVGRVVGSKGGGLDTLIGHLNSMTALHQSASSLSGAMALGCSIWASFTDAVLSTMGHFGISQSSPAYIVKASTSADLQRRLLYFNLHGMDTGTDWWGSDTERLWDCVSPAALGTANLSGAVIFAANCFGAAIDGRTIDSSCALTAIKAGAQAFIGSTCFAYGSGSSSNTNPLFSDRLAQLFFQKYAGAPSTGDAFVEARLAYVRENLINGFLNPTETKTALQFVFLGDPTL